MFAVLRLPTPVALLTALVAATPTTAQIAAGGADTTSVVFDVDDVVGLARSAQAQFERARIRFLPLTAEPFGGDCDEIVGRLCTTYGEGEWYPLPEDPQIAGLRSELIAELDSLQRLVPESDWILGQRVWYRAEHGAWDEARRTAESCGRARRWWCDALAGFALHGDGAYAQAEARFSAALAGMDPADARRWRVPRWPVDGAVRDRIADLPADSGEELVLLSRLWALADPLYLVEGNDRLTAHYARWTVARLRDRARNPFRLSWGDDLEQLTVRHGWELGWERRPARDFSRLDDVVGHKHPEGRDYLPPGDVLERPESATPDDLRADRSRPRSLYAPEYAPVLLPMDAQIAAFPRGPTTVWVSTYTLPEDTTYHVDHDHPRPWMEPGDQAEASDRIGLFAYSPVDGTVDGVQRSGRVDGALMLEVETGPYVLSAESFSPSRRRAGRFRTGMPERLAPPDIATLSDILMLASDGGDRTTLEDALDSALPAPSLRPGQPFAIGWEVSGLGFRPETMEFEVSVERTDRSFFGRIGGFLGISDRPQPLALSWQEPGPSEPGPVFRSLSLDIPELQEGEYEVRLVLRTIGRSDAVTTRPFRVAR
jgi:hypothetical protein